MIEAYPLQWPPGYPRTRTPSTSRFGAYDWSGRNSLTLHVALDEVSEEVRLLLRKKSLREGDLIISTNMRWRKSDGGIYAKEKEPDDSGVAVYFQLDGEMRCIPNDRWKTVRENLHAIALSIGALRGLERWGSREMVSTAFRGFHALPAPASDWRGILGVEPEAVREEIRAAYRREIKKAHPDAGGSDERMRAVQQAFDEARKEVGL